MAETDKVTKLNDEIVQAEAHRKEVDAKIHTLNTNISDLMNQETRLKGERANLTTQDGTAATDAKDAEIAKTREDLERTSGQYKAAFNERVTLDNKIDGLEDKAVRTHQFEELKANASEWVNDKVDTLKQHAEPLTAAAAMTAVDFAATHHEVLKHVANPEILRNVVAGAVVERVVHHSDALIGDAKEKLQGLADADAQKLEVDKAFHAEQLAAVDKFKGEVTSQIDASKAEMQKVMGGEFSLAGQKEFAQNEFNAAFQKANDFIAEQQQERDNFFSGNLSVLSPVEQQQNRTGMNEELHAAHYGLTRDLATKQAEINVDIGNKEMEQAEQKRLESKGVQKDDLPSAMEPLHRIQAQQRPNDIYMQANTIQAQQSPQMAMNPPAQSGPPGPEM